MRHTRSRQVEKVNSFMKGARNVPIWYMREHTAEIDKTFKWDREIGIVAWSYWVGKLETTRCALLKYPEHVKYQI